MHYAFAAFICALVGVVPLAVCRKPIAVIVQGVLSFSVLWWFLYLGTPSTVWPLFGVPGLYVFILWMVAAIIIIPSDSDDTWNIWLAVAAPAVTVVFYLLFWFMSWEMVNTQEYRNMIGAVETRTWTQDIQPKNPRHMRMSNKDNAYYLAQKAVGQDGSIGSQFEVEQNEITLQLINGELWYVAPLEFRGYSTWSANSASPGYVMISAENQDTQPKLVRFPQGEEMRYSPSAYFDYDLERHLRANGYSNRGLGDFNFEVDESHKAWWVVTIFHPTIQWNGEKVDGVAIVDPATGDGTFYPINSVPAWVDRVVPSDYVKNYITWWGEYRDGWWNSWWGKRNIVEPGDTSLIYGNDNQPEWVTDITSSNGNDNSLIGVVYTNSRTGKAVYYDVRGGATNSAVLDAVKNNQQISYRKLEGTDPQLYNIDGTMACVVPLFNGSNAFQGVAIVPIDNVQEVAYGETQYDALEQYQKYLSDKGVKTALTKDRILKFIEGVVDRSDKEVVAGATVHYLHVAEVPHLFTGGVGTSPKLASTEKGDRVKIGYYDSDSDVLPIHDFDNLSLPLSESKDQAAVRAAVDSARAGQEASQDAHTLRTRIDHLSDDQLQKLKDKIPPQ